MSNESPLHSVTLNSPVDPSVANVLQAVDPIARTAGCEYFVAGATARDLVLVNVFGLQPGRATRDIDFGIAVQSWAQFALLKERLVETGDFTSNPKALQRLTYSDQATRISIPVDLIPFGGVTALDGTIEWPPSPDIVMNVAGFEEALASSLPVEIAPGLTVRVSSLPGLTLLKLIAWSDRGHETNKDAADLYRLLTSYADAGNADRLYDSEMDLLDAVGFDMELAGAELLGRDVRRVCLPPLLIRLQSLVDSEIEFERLVLQIGQMTYAEALPGVARIVASFRRGLLNQ
jgi:predicted nucleotidyltransferase